VDVWSQKSNFCINFKEELLELTYDRALHALGEIAKSKFLLASNKEYKEDFKDV
jgi:hypothetical protein